jgi:hypothetical protein
MKNDTMTDYIRLNQNPVSGTSFTDNCLLYPGVYTYMVRALILQSSPGGTYYNLSQGISDTAWNNNDLKVHAGTDYSIANNVVSFTNSSINATSYFWDFGDGETSTLENPVHTFLYGDYTVILIANSSCDADTILIPVSVITGIDKITDRSGIRIYPNPSLGRFWISFDSSNCPDANIEIYNNIGVVIFKTNILQENMEIDLSNYPDGIYILLLNAGTGQLRGKTLLVKSNVTPSGFRN